MKRREVQRAPWWVSYAAPKGWYMPALLAGCLVGALAVYAGAPAWIIAGTGALASGLVDAYWRMTRVPSEDGPFSPLARLFYRRPEP